MEAYTAGSVAPAVIGELIKPGDEVKCPDTHANDLKDIE